jgi:hypothetical protein
MAKLSDIANSLNIDIFKEIKDKPANNANAPASATGLKRRHWLADPTTLETDNKGSIDQVYKPLNDKGFIKGVDQPDLSTPFINPVDQPLNNKGSIDQVYKPLNISLKDLRGNPLKIAQLIYLFTKDIEDKISERITQSKIIEALQISRDSARTGMRFLLKNKLIMRINFKPGKAGWSTYQLKESLFLEFRNPSYKGSIDQVYKPLNDKGFIRSSSYINTTTTEIDPLTSEWEIVDIEPLAHIGFTRDHLEEIISSNKLRSDVVQNSIYAYAHYLTKPDSKKINDRIKFFVKPLLEGKPFNPTDGFEHPHNKAMRIYLEKKREADSKRHEMQQELFDIAFKAWEQSKTSEEKDILLPEDVQKSRMTGEKIAALRMHFKNHVWPTTEEFKIASHGLEK